MRIILFCILSQFIFTGSLFATEIKGTPEELRKFLHPQNSTVSLRAQVERRVYADTAIVSLVVKNENKTLAKAMQENAKFRESLRLNLVALKVSEESIKNSKFSHTPQYGWFGDSPDSFEVINRVVITVTSEEGLQALATVTDKFDEMTIAGTEFKHSEKDKVHDELKKEAMNKILKDKAYYENTLKVTLKTSSFHDSGLIIGTTEGEMALSEDMLTNNRAKLASTSSMSSVKKPEPPKKQTFEEIKYSTNIAVQFEISEKDKKY